MKFLMRFLREETAATAVEYAVMLALILLTVFASIAAVGQSNNDMWEDSNKKLESVGF